FCDSRSLRMSGCHDMDRLPQISFDLRNLESTVSDKEEWQILLRITCHFEIKLGEREFYREIHFPVVEFVIQASKWKKDRRGSFCYNSMESPIGCLIEFRSLGNDQFLPYSSHQEFETADPVAGSC